VSFGHHDSAPAPASCQHAGPRKKLDLQHCSATFWQRMAEFGAILHQKEDPKTSSFSNRRIRLGEKTVSKSFRLSTGSPTLLSKLAIKSCGITGSASPSFHRPAQTEKVARLLCRDTGSKSFRFTKPSPPLLSKPANNHCGINRRPPPPTKKARDGGPTLAGDVVSKFFEFSMQWLHRPSCLANNHRRINRLASRCPERTSGPSLGVR